MIGSVHLHVRCQVLQGGRHSADGVSAIVADGPRPEHAAAWQWLGEGGCGNRRLWLGALARFVGIPPTQFARQQG